MAKLGCREIYFVKALNTSQIDFLIDRIKEVVGEMSIPSDYDVRVYKNVFTCCGIGGLGVVVEFVGPEEEGIKAIDMRAMSRIIEFCEKEGMDVGHHSLGQLECI